MRFLCNSYSFTWLLLRQKVRPCSRIIFSVVDNVYEISITLMLHVTGEADTTFDSGTGVMLLLLLLWELDYTFWFLA